MLLSTIFIATILDVCYASPLVLPVPEPKPMVIPPPPCTYMWEAVVNSTSPPWVDVPLLATGNTCTSGINIGCSTGITFSCSTTISYGFEFEGGPSFELSKVVSAAPYFGFSVNWATSDTTATSSTANCLVGGWQCSMQATSYKITTKGFYQYKRACGLKITYPLGPAMSHAYRVDAPAIGGGLNKNSNAATWIDFQTCIVWSGTDASSTGFLVALEVREKEVLLCGRRAGE